MQFLLTQACAQESFSQIRVVTEPERASITFDGEQKGTSPLNIHDIHPGKHMLTATLNNHKTHRQTVTVAGSERKTININLKPIVGLVLVHSVPSGSDVQIEGADRGQTPLLITDLAIGKYRMKLSKPGYLAKEIDVTISDRIPQKMDIELTSDFALLILDSVPTGASVTLNGAERDKTPCTINRVPTGDSSLEISAPGYYSYQENLKLSAGESQNIVATLKPIPAKLKIVSIPSGARIYLDNQFKGEAPVELTDMSPKSYRIRAEMTAYERMLRTVSLKRGSDIVEEFRLHRNCGTLEITTQPAGVDIFIDAKKLGSTVVKPNQTDRVSNPLVLDLLPVGKHQVTLTKKGYYVAEFVIDIERNQTVAKHYALKRRFIPNYEIRTESELYRGVYILTDPKGNVKLELKPGIYKTILRQDIRSGRPYREEQPETTEE